MTHHNHVKASTLVAVAKGTCKPINQDACVAVDLPEAGVWGLIVADGIGSDDGSEHISQGIVDSLASQLQDCFSTAEVTSCNPYHLYARACQQLAVHRDQVRLQDGDQAASHWAGGSTALCAIEEPARFVLTYCGNGAILHIRADFNDFPGHAILPWSSVDLLNPHSRYIDGKNVLYRYLSADATPEQTTPTVIALSKDIEGPGDIFLVCTDGISSRDQYTVGKNDLGIWTKTDAAILSLYPLLNSFFKGEDRTAERLQRHLQDYLQDLASSGIMDDDCAVGVLISSQALDYQAGRKQQIDNGSHP